MRDVDSARDNLTASPGGGFGFLAAYGTTMFISGFLALALPLDVAALVVMFQGGVALPVAFGLERILRFPKMASDNPLRPLAIQVAFVQVAALPAVIITYQLEPAYVPAVFAAIGGGHFLPYAWMHRANLYIILGVAVSIGAWLKPESGIETHSHTSCGSWELPTGLRHYCF